MSPQSQGKEDCWSTRGGGDILYYVGGPEAITHVSEYETERWDIKEAWGDCRVIETFSLFLPVFK